MVVPVRVHVPIIYFNPLFGWYLRFASCNPLYDIIYIYIYYTKLAFLDLVDNILYYYVAVISNF